MVTLDRAQKSVTATFSGGAVPPVISNVQASPSQTGATVTWTTDVPASSRLDYGLTTSYGANVSNGSLVTGHSLTLSGLTAGTLYHYKVSSTNANGTSTSNDLTFTTPVPAPVSGIASDDFNRCGVPGGAWVLVDPVGGGLAVTVGAGSSDARLAISVPGGVSHDPYNVNRSVRVMQPANNVDFQLQAKFDSAVTQRYQEQGLLVQQDSGNWLRFDMYSDGSSVFVYAGSTVNGSTGTMVNTAVAAAATPFWLRVTRSGSTWTFAYSADGSSWTTARTFTRIITVSQVGVFGGNDGSGASIPAHTALVDYFFDTASLISPEDGGSPSGNAVLSVATSGSGSVAQSPAGPYGCGQSVQLTAQPGAGASFQGWSGDLSGSTNPASVTLDRAQKSVTATFSGGAVPPVISNVQASPSQTGATVTWTTDVPASSRLDYGLTTSYGANVSNGSLVTGHSLTLSGLTAGTLYHYKVSSTNANGTSTSNDLTFTTQSNGSTSGVVSDDFNHPNLQTSIWTFEDPVGGARVSVDGAGSGNARLSLYVPGGVSHDPYNVNRSVRVMQPANDVDFQLVAKFDSAVTQRYQDQGLLVQQDSGNWLRFDMYSDGSSVFVYAGSTVNGSTGTMVNTAVAAATPSWQRVTRSGSTWTFADRPTGVAGRRRSASPAR